MWRKKQPCWSWSSTWLLKILVEFLRIILQTAPCHPPVKTTHTQRFSPGFLPHQPGHRASCGAIFDLQGRFGQAHLHLFRKFTWKFRGRNAHQNRQTNSPIVPLCGSKKVKKKQVQQIDVQKIVNLCGFFSCLLFPVVAWWIISVEKNVQQKKYLRFN